MNSGSDREWHGRIWVERGDGGILVDEQFTLNVLFHDWLPGEIPQVTKDNPD
jgi:hypothetical protein